MPAERIRKHLETEQRYHLIDLVAEELREIRISVYEELGSGRSACLSVTLSRGRSATTADEEIAIFAETMAMLSDGKLSGCNTLLELTCAKNSDDIPPIQAIAEAIQEIYDNRTLIQLYEIMLDSTPDTVLVKSEEVDTISRTPEYQTRADAILAGVRLEDVLGDYWENIFEASSS